jgi:hypothetical protein
MKLGRWNKSAGTRVCELLRQAILARIETRVYNTIWDTIPCQSKGGGPHDHSLTP